MVRWFVPLTAASQLALSACGQSNVPSSAERESRTETPAANSKESPVANNDWQKSFVHSAMDGDRLVVQNDFPENDSTLRVILSCVEKTGQLKVVIESYEGAGASSAFVTKMSTVVGRIKFGGANPKPIADYFDEDQYSNVVSWNVSRTVRVAKAENATAQRGFKPKTERGERVIDAIKFAAARAFVSAFSGAGLPGEETGISFKRFLQSQWSEENYDAVFGAGSAREVGAGNYLKPLLPVAIEVSNSRGTFEVQIPLNDANIDEVINLCSVQFRRAPIPTADNATRASLADNSSKTTNVGSSNGAIANWPSQISAKITRAWLKPPSAVPGIECVVHVTQVPGGEVTDVRIGTCNGDQAVRESIKAAVYRASPLPPPPDPTLFDPNVDITFKPD